MKKLHLTYQEFLSNKKTISNTMLDHYAILGFLAEGATAKVFQGINCQMKTKVAIKFIDFKQYFSSQRAYNQYQQSFLRNMIKREAENLSKMNSQYIIKLYDFYMNQNFAILVEEFCNGDNLHDYITKSKKIAEDEIIYIFRQIFLGVASMHEKKIIHRDIKSENIMFHNGIIKILDLGLSKQLSNSETFQNTYSGTLTHMAPEILAHEKYYDFKADIWSLGVVLYQLAYGLLPYEPTNPPKMLEKIRNKNIFPKNESKNGRCPSLKLRELMKSMLTIESKDRKSWEQLIKEPILCENNQFLPNKYIRIVKISEVQEIKSEITENSTENQSIDSEKNLQSTNEQFEPDIKFCLLPFPESDVAKLLSTLDNSEEQNFQIVKQYFLDCKKSEFILHNIITPLENNPKILNLKERKNMELMYLLSVRCYCNMSFINQDIHNIKLQSKSNYEVMKLKAIVGSLYQNTKKRFEYYGDQLRNIQDSYGSIISDRYLKIFNSSSVKTKQEFLSGSQINNFPTIKHSKSLLEMKKSSSKKELKKQVNSEIVEESTPSGYNRSEQILYTWNNYIRFILLRIDRQKYGELYQSLAKYIQINRVTLKEIGEINFDQFIDHILKK